MNISIVVTLIFYKLLLLGIGLWTNQRNRTKDDFFLGGRSLGPVIAAVSYCASSSSAWTLLGMSGVAYSIGVSSLWLAFGAIFGASFAWLWIAPRLLEHSHRKKLLTLTDFLTEGASSLQAKRIRLAATAILLFSFILYVAAQFQGAGTTFNAVFDLNANTSILLGGMIVIVYVLLGGFWAVSITDTLQGLVMLSAAIVLPLLALYHAGGYAGIHSSLEAQQLDTLLALNFKHTGLGAAGFILGGLAVGLSTFGQPHLVSRFMALKNQQALRYARWIAIGWFALVFLGMCLLGLAMRALLPEMNNPEALFFEAAANLLPNIFAGIMIAAVLSAIMSTADSMLLAAAASISHDLGVAARYPKKELFVARLSMVALSLAAIFLALILPASIFDRALFAWVAIGSAFGPILVFKLSGRSASSNAILWAMILSFSLAVGLHNLPNTPGDIAERTLPFLSGLLTLFFMGRYSYPTKDTKII